MVVWKKERSNLKTPQWLTSNQNGRFGIHLALQHIFTTRAGAIGSKLWVALALLLAFVVGICCTYWNHTMLSCIGVGLARRYRGETQHRTSISSTQCEGRRSIFIFSVVFWCPYCCCLGISNALVHFLKILFFCGFFCFCTGKVVLDTVVPALSDWAKTSAYFAQLQLSGTVDSGPKENQQVLYLASSSLCFCQLLFISPPFHLIRSTSCMGFLLTRKH